METTVAYGIDNFTDEDMAFWESVEPFGKVMDKIIAGKGKNH